MGKPALNDAGQYDQAGTTAETVGQRPAEGAAVLPISRRRRLARFSARALIVLVLIMAAIVAAGFYFLRGQEFSHARIDTEVHRALKSVLGDRYDVKVGRTGLRLKSNLLVALNGADVEIRSAEDGKTIAHIDSVNVGFKPLSFVSGPLRIGVIELKGGELDATALTKTGKGATGGDLSAYDLTALLSGIGQAVSQLEEPFRAGNISQILLSDYRVIGGMPGSGAALTIDEARIGLDHDRIELRSRNRSAHSEFALNADWAQTPGDGRQLTLGAGPISAREWFGSPDPVSTLGVGIGSDLALRIDARLPYAAGLKPQQPVVKIQAEDGRLRIGRRPVTDVKYAVLNLRLIPEMNRIDLERSQLSAGGVTMGLLGGMQPIDPKQGPGGGLELELIGEKINVAPILTDDEPVAAAMKLHGSWQPESQVLDLNDILVRTEEGDLAASAELTFSGDSPAIKAQLAAETFSTASLRHLWPFFFAPNPRHWAQDNVYRGRLIGIEARLNLAAGRILAIDRGGGFDNGEFDLTAEFEQVRFNTYGELPPIRQTAGRLEINDSKMLVTANRGTVFADNGDRLAIGGSRFAIGDIFAQPAFADLDLAISGPLAGVAMVADAKPLEVARMAAINPATLSGKAMVEADARFSLAHRPDNPPVAWSAITTLTEASSSEPLFGRMVSDAELTLEAEPRRVKAQGKAHIDGIATELEIVEPLGEASPEVRSASYTADIASTDLVDQGIRLSPVVEGRLGVAITSKSDGPQRYSIDLTKAELALPWVGWLKGAGIPAHAEFALVTRDGVSSLSDLKLTGEGFAATGELVVDNDGLISADMQNVSLNGEDNFDVTIGRRENGYTITANGEAYDARALINLLIHTQGFASEQATIDVTAKANFGALMGFSGQFMKNAIVSYQTDGGVLTAFNLRGALSDKISSIAAKRQGSATRFDFSSGDAGAALAMVALYKNMRGGKLSATLTQQGDGPYKGAVTIDDFIIEDEERLASLVSAPVSDRSLKKASGELKKIDTSRVGFEDFRASIEQGEGYLKVSQGRVRNTQIGLTFEGTLYDAAEQMNVRGTFMPLFAISRLVGLIPIVGDIFSNGRDSGLIGITYQLKGPAKNPGIAVNPISIVAPGIFRKIFEFKE